MKEQISEKSLKQVEEFWNENLCGNHFVNAKFPSPEFFEQYRNFRFKKTHHLDKYINWKGASEKDLLEIGLGIGADGTRWAQYAKTYTGLDLTSEAVKATELHFALLNFKGKIVQGNAEKMPFPNENFDLVYSHGVLHHTTNINNTFSEIHRVLRSNGQFIVMLYAKGSFNYWVRIQFYFRIRLIFEIMKNNIGLKSNKLWAEHLNNFHSKGWKYLNWKNFPHHCTDGPGCEIANIYTKREIRKLLRENGFEVEKMRKAHFPLGARFPSFERKLASLIGFHQLTWAKKI